MARTGLQKRDVKTPIAAEEKELIVEEAAVEDRLERAPAIKFDPNFWVRGFLVPEREEDYI